MVFMLMEPCRSVQLGVYRLIRVNKLNEDGAAKGHWPVAWPDWFSGVSGGLSLVVVRPSPVHLHTRPPMIQDIGLAAAVRDLVWEGG